MNYQNVSIENMANIAIEIIATGINTVLFKGNLGSGKTTLIKHMAVHLNLKDMVSSPTFGYVNVYDQSVFHFDCYRLKNLYEALDFGIDEYLDSDNLTWIEWPEKIMDIIQKPYLCVELKHNANQTRDIAITKVV